jgi:hypothetical protein
MKKQTGRLFFFLAAMTVANAQTVSAQDERDALRFSFLQPQGTARSIGIGSALGSVGGDFTSLAVNPAGIGIYRRSEFMVSPSLMFANTTSDYTGNTAEESGSHFSFSNVGIVSAKVETGRRRQRSGWSSVAFGFGLTRLADFTRNYTYEGRNTTSSGSFVFENDANQFGLSGNSLISTPADLGYQSYLLDAFTDSATGRPFYRSVVNPTDTSAVSQSTIIRERGGISELGLTFGGNYEDKLLIGATLGIPIVRYIRSKTFEERDLSGKDNNDFDYFRYSNDLKTTGAGVNLKLGFIYKPTDNFRFGAAIHTPTYLSLNDISNQSLIANTEGTIGTQTATATENQYDYNLTTPWRAVVSATAMFGAYGFFTIDYEFVDYASSRFKFGLSADEKDYQRYVNDLIKSTYKGASNIRTGLEIRLDNFMIRGGFGYYGNPYKSDVKSSAIATGQPGPASAERLSFSGGIGFRFANAFLDLAFVHHRIKTSEQPYTLADTDQPGTLYYGLVVPTAQLTTGANNAVLTLGFKL